MRCDRHKKDQICGCMWCGRRLCEFCIAKRDGKKYYCDKCVGLLGGMRRERFPLASPNPPPSTGRRYMMRDGRLVMNGGEE